MKKEILASRVIQESMKELARLCRADATSLGNAHILLTGGTGFFGSWIIVSFIALRQSGLPIEMTVLSRDPDVFLDKNPSFKNQPGLVFRKGDVLDATIPFSITHVFHFATAGASSAGAASEEEVRQTVVEGTRHMLAEAKRVGAARFLLASSGAVYGADFTDRATEDRLDPQAHLTVYGAAKRDAESLCQNAAIARDIETVIARGFTFCGPLFPVEGPYVISNFMSGVLSGATLNVKTPNSIRCFLDGRDLVTVLWKLLAKGQNGQAYNIGSDEAVTMSELADLMRAVALKISRRVPEVRLLTPPAPPHPDVYRPSIARLQTEFGWVPKIKLRESLRHQAEWAIEAGY